MTSWAQALGTLATWIGAAFAARAVFLAVRLAVQSPGIDRRAALTALAWSCGLGAVGLVLGNLAFPVAGIGIPLAWPVMAVQLWLAALLGALGLVQLVKGGMARSGRLLAQALAWIVFGVAVLGLPRANTEPPRFLVGHVMLDARGAVALGFLAVATVVAMALAATSAKAKGAVTGLASQVALLVGCVVFGLPFLFLLVTSFKEDIDMSSPNGIVWVPRVVQTAPVMNPEDPYYQAKYKGTTVQADLDKVNPDGTLSLRVAHPLIFGGYTFNVPKEQARQIPREMPLVTASLGGQLVEGVVVRKLPDGSEDVEIRSPESLKGQRHVFLPKEAKDVRPVSLKWKNYVEALEYLPPEAQYGWTYLRNTLWLVVMNVLGALTSSSIVAFAFARLRFPGREVLFKVMLSTMMLPAAVTLLPQFLIFRSFGWIDSLKPLWVTSWFAAAFNVFMLRQFFQQVPYELEDAAKIDGCSYLRSLWSVMLPQVKPALAVIAIMTFMGAWNNFMGPLVYSSSPETLPISYAVQLFNGERNGEPGLLMAFVTMSLVPVIALFAFAQRFFIEGVTLSGLGGR